MVSYCLKQLDNFDMKTVLIYDFCYLFVRIPVLQYGRLFGFHVLLNKRGLTDNQPGSAGRETGRKKSVLHNTPTW